MSWSQTIKDLLKGQKQKDKKNIKEYLERIDEGEDKEEPPPKPKPRKKRSKKK